MGLKRIPANYWQRLAAGRNVGLKFFLALMGIVGAGTTIYVGAGGAMNAWAALLMIALCIVIPVIAAFVRGRQKFLPDSIVDEVGADVPYTCQHCSADHLAEACEMTRPYYGSEYVRSEIAEQWRARNPNAFVEILNDKGELCACFGILALTDSFREQFMAGRVADTQMGADCILDAGESRKSTILYISGVVVRNPSTYLGSKRASVMVWAIVAYLKQAYGLRKERTLIAIAANRESERFMEHLGFDLIGRASQRVDKCNMYSYAFSRESVDALLSRIGDMSPMCKCDYTTCGPY